MDKQSKLEKLQAKINSFLKIGKELQKLGMCGVTHDSPRNYLQATFCGLHKMSKVYGLDLAIVEWRSDHNQWDVSISELKMFAIATDRELESEGLLPEKV